MDTNNTNLQAAVTSIIANAQTIDAIRTKAVGADIYETGQMLLMDKFSLSQTESAEIVDGIKAGIESYKTTQTAMSDNREITVRESLAKAVEGMTNEESVHYLAAMLSSLELASSDTELSQNVIDAKLDSNLTKTIEELTDSIVIALDTLPLDTLANAAHSLDSQTIASVAAAIDKNSEEFRFTAALQLYIAQREGTFKPEEKAEPLAPNVIGFLACGAVDAMQATNDFKEGKISLTKWQQILKNILGTLFVITACVLASIGMAVLCAPLTITLMSILGNGFLGTLLTMFIILPVISYGSDKAMPVIMNLVERLAPVYDKVIVEITAYANDLYTKVAVWVKAHIVDPIAVRSTTANETANVQSQPTQVAINSIPANA